MSQKKFIIDGGFQTNADSVITGNLEMTGHIIPSVDSDGTTGYDLGTPTAKWRDLYLSSGSLYIDGQKVLESNSGTIVVQADPDQSLTTKTTGSGVLTFQSPNPIAIAATLQMGTGKRITSADGVAVVFGDKVDLDNNQIINVAAPTADGHAATKSYVDAAVSGIINGAPGALDTLNELANALGDDANFAASVTTALATKATITYVDQQVAQAVINANDSSSATTDALDLRLNGAEADITALETDLATEESARIAGDAATLASAQTYADTAEADAIASANGYTDGEISTLDAALKAYADTAESDAKAYTDTRETAITTAYEAYADQAEVDAKAYTDTRETAITTAYEAYADQAEADAVTTANAYTDGRETAITTAYQAADTTLQSNIDAEAARIDAILLSADADKDTFAEIVTFINAVDTVNDTALGTEITTRAAADNTLQNNINTETAARIAGDAATLASAQTYADTAEADAISSANTYTDGEISTLDAALKAYADTAEADAIASANGYTDGEISTLDAALKAYADTAESDAVTTATNYTDTREAAITTAYQSYADTAEADAISSANSYTDGEIATLDAALKTYADTAEADAKAYTNTREAAITSAYGTADTTVATNAAADATSKANAALASANSYTDTAISNVINGAPGALDTLNELAAALGDDANFASTVTTELNNIKSAAVNSFTTFHERGANFTDTEETTNLTGTVSRTFTSLANAVHYDVYLNRVLLRGPETGVADREYTVSGTTITFEVGTVASSDNIEVRGFSVGTIS